MDNDNDNITPKTNVLHPNDYYKTVKLPGWFCSECGKWRAKRYYDNIEHDKPLNSKRCTFCIKKENNGSKEY